MGFSQIDAQEVQGIFFFFFKENLLFLIGSFNHVVHIYKSSNLLQEGRELLHFPDAVDPFSFFFSLLLNIFGMEKRGV